MDCLIWLFATMEPSQWVCASALYVLLSVYQPSNPAYHDDSSKIVFASSRDMVLKRLH